MLLYEKDDQRGVIYDGENVSLVPEGARVLGVYKDLNARREEVQECTLDELQRILGMY